KSKDKHHCDDDWWKSKDKHNCDDDWWKSKDKHHCDGGNLKINTIVIMIGSLSEISVVVNVSLFVVIVKRNIVKFFNASLKAKNMS
ncbi:hypothetical protein, partial [Bacillus sp. AY1-10]|uniref:hypothetical protein n=1 Tax=Bacillus sp. AY1-10 TaxID=2217823 RepID=UPI00351B0207